VPVDLLEPVERLGDLFAPIRGLRQQLPKPANRRVYDAGLMFWLTWKTFSGSYCALIFARRS